MYTIIFFILITVQGYQIREYSDVNLLDNAHFYPNAGIYLEPSGQYLQYSGSISIPFVYVLPSLEFAKSSYCPGHQAIINAQKLVMEHIKETITPLNKDSKRGKRSLIPLVSLLTGGLSVWNTIELQSVKNHLMWMTENSMVINKVISNITDSQHVIIDNVKNLIAVVGDQSYVLKRILNTTECLQRDNDNFQSFMTNWLYSAPMEFIEAYSSAVTGKLTPELLSARNLKRVISNHIETVNTIYRMEPETVYEFGQVLLMEAIVDNNAILKGIIQLPKILGISPTPMYNVYTVNIIQNGFDMKYVLPPLLICSNPPDCWEVDYNMCIRKSHRLICLYGAKTNPYTCLMHIHNNFTTTCTGLIKKQQGPEAVQTKSGVLLGGSNQYHQVYKRVGDIDIKTKLYKPNNVATMIRASDGDWLSINGSVYSTKIIGFDYNFSVYISSQKDITSINQKEIDFDWKEMSRIEFTPISYQEYHSILIGIILLVNIGIIILCFYLWYKLNNLTISKNKLSSTPLIGLR